MEIAIFGGTFNPPTLAHEAMIGAALMRNDIDEVWVMPSGSRIDKPDIQADEKRIGMLMLLKTASFDNDPRFKISDFELSLPRPTQTYRTVKALKRVFPGHHFRFIFGVDSYLDMPNWDYGEQLKTEIDVLLVERAGYERPPENNKVSYLEVPGAVELALSSTEVRQSLALGRCISGMVSPELENYLKKNQLYGTVQ